MKKVSLPILGLCLILTGCGKTYSSESIENNSSTNSSSSSQSHSSSNENEELKKIISQLSTNCKSEIQLEDKSSQETSYRKTLYQVTSENRIYALSKSSLKEEETKNYNKVYFSDNEGELKDYLYSEIISPQNEVEKNYVDLGNGKVSIDEVVINPFSFISSSDFFNVSTNTFSFLNEQNEKDFVNSFLELPKGTVFSYSNVAICNSLEKTLCYTLQTEQYNLTINFSSESNSISHLMPFKEDNSDKSDLVKAINNLGHNYTATHYRSGKKSISFFASDSIAFDFEANGLSEQDCYFSKKNSLILNRLVYGKREGIGTTTWDESNYTEMDYLNNMKYSEFEVRLSQINLGLFVNNGDGTYTSLLGTQSYLFPYCQPTYNVRQQFVDDAIRVVIKLDNQTISQIVLEYNYGVSESSIYKRKDTIVFSDVGTTSIPQDFLKTLDYEMAIPKEKVLGTWNFEVNNIEVKLQLKNNLEAIYTVDGEEYFIDCYHYVELLRDGEETITIEFDYKDETRFARFSFDELNDNLSGFDSSYSNTVEDFFNLDSYAHSYIHEM